MPRCTCEIGMSVQGEIANHFHVVVLGFVLCPIADEKRIVPLDFVGVALVAVVVNLRNDAVDAIRKEEAQGEVPCKATASPSDRKKSEMVNKRMVVSYDTQRCNEKKVVYMEASYHATISDS